MKSPLQSKLALLGCTPIIALFSAPIPPVIAQSSSKEPIQEIYKEDKRT
jgi:hypothetical protein